MIEMLKKTYLAGADLAHKTWDEVEALSKDLVKKAKMGEKEGSKFLKDMKSRYDDTQKKTGRYIERVVRDILKKMDVATAADIKALKKEIQQLKKATGTTGAKKRTTATAKKRVGRTTAKKRTTTTAKKRPAARTTKKTTGRAKPKKPTATKAAKKPARKAGAKKR